MTPAIYALPTATLHCQVPVNVCVRTATIDLLRTILMLPALVSIWMECLKARRAANERECAWMIQGSCNSPLLMTSEITQNFPLLLQLTTAYIHSLNVDEKAEVYPHAFYNVDALVKLCFENTGVLQY